MAFNSIPEYDASTPGNNTDIGGVSVAEGWPAANINNSIRQLLTQLKQYLANSATVASASTVDLGAQTANYITISGTTTITAFGTKAAGTWRQVRFSGALTLTYNATSLILPGAANITTAAGDTSVWVSEGAGNWRCVSYTRASGLPIINPTVAPSYNSAAGCLPSSITGAATTATITVGSGQVADSTNTTLLTSAGYSWAVTNGNAINGYQGGTTLPNSSTIHMFICNGASGTGSFASTSLTPTLPTGYTTYYRRIFSFKTTGAGAPIPYTAIETEGGSLVCWLTTQVLDFNATTLGTSRTALPLSVPGGIKVQPFIRANTNQGTVQAVILTSGDETDVAPSTVTSSGGGWFNGAAPGWDLADNGSNIGAAPTLPYLTTDTSGQIGARATVASYHMSLVTRGWKDWRRS